MATNNGLFQITLENKPFNKEQAFTAGGDYKYSTAVWDIAVHEVTWNVNPTFIENADELRGLTSMPWHDGAGSMAAEITAKARVRPRMLGLLCHMVTGGNVTDVVGAASPPTTGHVASSINPLDSNGSSVTAYEHRYYWRGEDATNDNDYIHQTNCNDNTDEPVTATIKFAPTKGDGWKASGCGLTTLAFSFEDSGALVADMVFRGLYFVNDNALALTPTYETDVPLKRSNFKFANAAMSASTSKAIDVNWAIENNLSNFFSFGVNSEWPDAIEYEDLWARVGGSVTKRQVLKADYDKWVGSGADGHFAECIEGFGAELSTDTDVNTTFAFYVHLDAVQYMAMNPEAITNKRRIGVSFDWEARTDGGGGTGRFCDLYVVNLEANSVYYTWAA